MIIINRFSGDYFFLSNFFDCEFDIDGKKFKSVERFVQSQKTLNREESDRIRLSESNGKARKSGRSCTLRSDWEEIKEDVMRRGLRGKFTKREIRERLLNTGNSILIEGNDWNDTFWGVNLKTGEGKNRLGILLMELREELKTGS